MGKIAIGVLMSAVFLSGCVKSPLVPSAGDIWKEALAQEFRMRFHHLKKKHKTPRVKQRIKEVRRYIKVNTQVKDWTAWVDALDCLQRKPKKGWSKVQKYLCGKLSTLIAQNAIMTWVLMQ